MAMPVGAAAVAGGVLLFRAMVHRKRASLLSQVPYISAEEKTDPSDSRADVQVPAIFVSHSCRQKPFVELLHDALQSANHIVFVDRHVSHKGTPFPRHIERAVRCCKLGVVVLSDDYLTSKWPMLELEMLVLHRGPDVKQLVLPLFYKLRPEDLESPTNLSKWRHMWKKKAGGNAEQWEQAVKALGSITGEVFIQGTSELAYIKKVVQRICFLLPCQVPYDLSSVQGHQRLAKEISSEFEHLESRHCREACLVGLHGVGGMGKTTLCKIMVNFYTSQYQGRSCLIELPTNGDKLQIVQECKLALKRLTNPSNDPRLNEVDSFDEVVELMREHSRNNDMFLAIDNVWENSLEEVERLLAVGFTANSKILLTSRSVQALRVLLWEHYNASIGSLPAPEHEEAFQIFQNTFQLGDVSSLVDRNRIDGVLLICMFSSHYHPLALKALAQHANSMCALGDLKNIERHLSLILKEIRNAELQNIEQVIGLNYESLPQHKKHIFLDIAVLQKHFNVTTYAKAHWWLCSLYKKFSKTKITRLIHELALHGVIEIETDKDGAKMIRVHDLFLDLACREVANSSRFFTRESTKSVEEMEWERLERVILRGGEDPRFIQKLQKQKCPKLQVLYAAGIDFRSKFRLDFMPCLCIFILKSVTFASIENWSAATGLAIVELSDLLHAHALEPIPSMPSLEELTIHNLRAQPSKPIASILRTKPLKPMLSMPSLMKEVTIDKSMIFGVARGAEGMAASRVMPNLRLGPIRSAERPMAAAASRVLNLHGSVQLQKLHVSWSHDFVDRIAGLDGVKNVGSLSIEWCSSQKNLDGLSGLIRLETLRVGYCASVKKIPDLSGLTCLQTLELYSNASMEEVECLSNALKNISISYCGVLRKMPDVSGLACLERLNLASNGSMEEVGGVYLSSTLMHLSIKGCRHLRRFPSFDGCIHLQSLAASAQHIRYGSSLESLENLHSLHLTDAGEWSCEYQWEYLTLLQDLSIQGCCSVKMDVGCLSSLTHLKHLMVSRCEALEEIGDLSKLHSLENLDIEYCPSLKRLAGLVGIASHQLNHLRLCYCGPLEESILPDVSLLRTMENVFIGPASSLNI